MTGVFAGACEDYAQAGWPCVIPVPAESKFPPPEGFTGAAGRDTTRDQLAAWAASRGEDSIALRVPDGVIGIDVDHYDKGGVAKRGNDTLAELEERWGPLPPTWSSTARGTAAGPGPSRIMFFLAPAGLRYATRLGADIDIIQHHHRYAVVPPSPHAGTGTSYRWYGPDGLPAGELPGPGSLGILPPSWVAGLTEGATAGSPAAADRSSGDALLKILLADVSMPCAEIDYAGRVALDELAGALAGSRHDVMTGCVYRVVQMGAEGHSGSGWILAQWLGARWDELTAGEDRDAEFDAMLLSASRKAVTKQGGPVTAGRDPCLTAPIGWDEAMRAQGKNENAREADRGADDPPPDGLLEHPPPWSPRGEWGAHPFVTAAGLDSMLARDVLARTYPCHRYATDAGSWVVRGAVRWEASRADMARLAVDEMFWLMPRGDPDAPKDSPPQLEAARRARFGTTASANAVALKMTAQVAADTHPCSLRLAELDQDPGILWAGGVAWDIAASAGYPVIATRVDPGRPHLHTAACVPADVPTPLFDAFTAAVWPDEEMRRWALRVLSVAFTGHPDKSLPILLGPTDAGKTSVIQLLMSVLGSYALKSADARLLNAADRSHASIVYALKGCRLAFIDEAPRAGHQAQERLKALTGGAPLTGNRMGENPITFAPTHTLVLTANPDSEPVLTDPAVRRRVRLLTCDGDPGAVSAARAAIGFLSGRAWRAEAPGVLALMMGHAAAWLADPSSAGNGAAPAFAQAAAEHVARSQDVILSWVTDATESHEEGSRSRSLYESFVAWCKANAVAQVPSETRWGRRLSELGYPPAKRRDAFYRPLRLRTAWGGAGDYESSPRGVAEKHESLPGGVAGKPPGPVVGSPGSVVGSVVGSGQTHHTDNPRSNPPQPTTVVGVVGTMPIYTHTRAHTPAHMHIRDNGNPPTHHTHHTHHSSQVSEGAGENGPTTEPTTAAKPTTLAAVNPPPPPPPPAARPATPPVTGTVAFDLETASADELFTYTDGDEAGFVRLAGVLGADGEPAVVTVPELLARLEQAEVIEGHNILGFDLIALARHHGADYARLAAKARDTELVARQADPPRSRESHAADSYDLDSVAGRLGLPGKTDSAARLKRKFGGWDKIPLDDPEYRAYLEGDLRATAAVAAAMRERYPADPYLDREHKLAAIAGRMTLNGFRVDRELLGERLGAGQERKRAALEALNEFWGLPLSRQVLRGRGKARAESTEAVDAPLASDAGRAWLGGIWERYGIASPPRTGKGHPHGTGILTPVGFTPVEALRPGDFVIGSNGQPVKITGTFRRGVLPVYRVSFNDGSSVRVDGDHLWAVRTHDQVKDFARGRGSNDARAVETRELARTLHRRWEIPQVSAPVEMPVRDLPVDPYILGVLLGDGSLTSTGASFTPGDVLVPAEVAHRLPGELVLSHYPRSGQESRDSWAITIGSPGGRLPDGSYFRNPVQAALEGMGLAGKRSTDKFIPDDYLYASMSQRLDLLRGLMDTDGSLSRNGTGWATGFASASERLCDQVRFLVESFGGVARKTARQAPKYTYRGEYRTGQPSYQLSISMTVSPFLVRAGWAPLPYRKPKRVIRSIEPDGEAQVTCLRVDAADALYLTEHCIVTHNTQKLSTGADDLKKVAADPRCPDQLRQVIRLIGIVVGTRTVYQTAADCLTAGGRVHPGNSFRQASGRWSVTNPGLTVFGKRGGRHVERDIFLPDEGHVLLSFDLSQVDMRAMAGHSQDPNYTALFAPGRDAHQEIADQVGLDRQSAKAIGHGWNYGLGATRMIANGLDPGKVAAFIAGMEARFPRLIAWREQIRERGKAGEVLDNGFGRRMRCDPERAYTVAPALMGQGGARDIMCESILNLPAELHPMLRTMVHDEVLLSVSKDIVRDVITMVREAMTWEWRGVPITCDMSLGANWGECSAH